MAMAGLCKALRAAGADVSALATFRAGEAHDIADDLTASGVPVRLASAGELAARMRESVVACDVVHAHGVWEAIQHCAVVEAGRSGKPAVITPHGMLSQWSLSQKWLKKRIYLALRLRRDLDRASAIHCTSVAERDAMKPLGLRAPVIVEPWGIDISEFAALPPRGTFRARFPELGEDRIIVFLGRIHPGKGLEYLVPALGEARIPNVKLVVIGPDANGFQRTIEGLIDRNGLAGRVLFTGMLRGADRLAGLADADLLALPSEHENFGVVVAEALACGTPVVVSDGVAIHDQIARGNVGAVVPARDIPALTRELKRWLGEDEPLRRAAAERARSFAVETFGWHAIARRWIEHYRALKPAQGG